MQKIPTLFKRGDDFKVTEDVNPGCEWVLNGEGKATEKVDGTNIQVTINEERVVKVEKRRNPNKQEKAAGVGPGYVDANRSDPSDKHIFGCVDNTDFSKIDDGIYQAEAFGKKIQGDPLRIGTQQIYFFTLCPQEILSVPRNHKRLKEFFADTDRSRSKINKNCLLEGIVFHHPDGRAVKIKRKDFRK